MNSEVNITVRVISPHLSIYPNPINFGIGDTLVVGRRDDEYPGWIWTRTPDGNEGWAPEEVLTLWGKCATALENYVATELCTELHEVLTVQRKLAGWLWVTRESGDNGWVPAGTVIPVYDDKTT